MKSLNFVSGTILATCLAAGQLFAQSANTANFSQKDKDVLAKLTQASIHEVEIGKIAEQKASNPAVKDFGKRMVDDHSKLQKQSEQLASKAGIALKMEMEPSQHAMMQDLNARSGADFDQHYIQGMMKDHQKDIAELQKYALSTQNIQMKGLLEKTLPILENHAIVAAHVAGQLGLSAQAGLNQPEHPSA